DMMITAWRKEAPGSDKEALKVQIQKVVASFQKQGVFTDSYLKSGIQVITKEGTLQIHEGLLCLSSELFTSMMERGMKESREKTINFADRYCHKTIELFHHFILTGTLPGCEKMKQAERLVAFVELLDFAHYIQHTALLKEVEMRLNHLLKAKDFKPESIQKLQEALELLKKIAHLHPKLASLAFHLLENKYGFDIVRRTVSETEFSLPISQVWMLDSDSMAEYLETQVKARESAPVAAASSSASSASLHVPESAVSSSSFAEDAELISSVLRSLVRGVDFVDAADSNYVPMLELYGDKPGEELTSFTVAKTVAQEAIQPLIESVAIACPKIRDFYLPFVGS
ncbi:MAG TPA: hypothetical protein VN457_02070, partial [Chlamydiales bacterium]|nr:hypothetical protein [Chlamydiales bacterium]